METGWFSHGRVVSRARSSKAALFLPAAVELAVTAGRDAVESLGDPRENVRPWNGWFSALFRAAAVATEQTSTIVLFPSADLPPPTKIHPSKVSQTAKALDTRPRKVKEALSVTRP